MAGQVLDVAAAERFSGEFPAEAFYKIPVSFGQLEFQVDKVSVGLEHISRTELLAQLQAGLVELQFAQETC